MYLDYTEYKNLGGTLSEPAFNSLIFEAQTKIDYYTFNRLKNDTVISDKVKRCIIKILSLLNAYNEYEKKVTDISHPVVSSSSNDGVSISFGGYLGHTSPQDIENISKRTEADIRATVRMWLSGETNQKGEVLLYRGVYK